VNIVLSTRSFAAAGGSETYILTLAEQLLRLGHEVVVFTEETGAMTEFATGRGTLVTTRLQDLPEHCDAVLAQDAVVAYRLAERYPRTPQLFRAASDLYDLSLPPGLSEIVAGVVVLSNRVERRVRHLAARHKVHRLRQPIDTERFMPAGDPPAKPRKAVLLGNYLRGRRLDMIRSALERRGVSCDVVGRTGRPTPIPEQAIWEAHFGGDGWVTAERYPAMEGDNFAGQTRFPVCTPAQLDDELAIYDQDMGIVNRELVTSYHGARSHAGEICSLLEPTGESIETADAPLRELARLVRLQWLTEVRAIGFEEASRRAREDAERTRTELGQVSNELGRVSRELGRVSHELERATLELGLLSGQLAGYRELAQTRRVRFGVTLGTMADAARRVGSTR
jgi:hypothetical protein